MAAASSLENELLLACTQTHFQSESVQKLVQQNIDWEGFLEKGIQSGLSPMIYSKLKKAGATGYSPQTIIDRLEGLYYGYTLENSKLYRTLSVLLTAFSKGDIPIIALKGAALAECVYEEIGLRPMFDVDLLIRKEDIPAAEHLLEQLEYSPQEIRNFNLGKNITIPPTT